MATLSCAGLRPYLSRLDVRHIGVYRHAQPGRCHLHEIVDLPGMACAIDWCILSPVGADLVEVCTGGATCAACLCSSGIVLVLGLSIGGAE